jgi:hypothetical protein
MQFSPAAYKADTHSQAPQVATQEALQDVGPLLMDRVGEGRHSIARKGVAETSAEAFHSLPIRGYLQPKEQAVMALFTGPGVALSRQQIAPLSGLPINCVCGRVDSLLSAGHLVEEGDRICPLTRKRQKLLRLPQPVQASLLEEAYGR